MKQKLHHVEKRRRRQGKTDYKARKGLLSSSMPRLVVRKTNCYIISQIVESSEAQDRVVASANSKLLEKYGWKLSKKSVPAAYLTGFILGSKLKGRGQSQSQNQNVILDIGLARSTKGSCLYACLKGAIDAGVKVLYSPKVLPDNARVVGKHISQDVEKKFEEVKNKILEKVELK